MKAAKSQHRSHFLLDSFTAADGSICRSRVGRKAEEMIRILVMVGSQHDSQSNRIWTTNQSMGANSRIKTEDCRTMQFHDHIAQEKLIPRKL